MNIKLVKFLSALCALLLVIILAEWWYANRAQKQLITSIQTTTKQKHEVAQLPALELTRQPESSFVNLVNRPLFINGRRPVIEASANTQKKTTTAKKLDDKFNWSLNGIYTNKRTLFALLSRTGGKVPKDNYRKVTKNSEVDGWIVSKVDKEKITLVLDDQEKELLLRKPKPKKAGAMLPNQVVMPMPMQDPALQGQMPPEGLPPGTSPDMMPGGVPPAPIPGMPGVPGAVPQPMPEPIPEMMPEPELIPEPIPEPEIIPEEPSDIYLENNENVPLQ